MQQLWIYAALLGVLVSGAGGFTLGQRLARGQCAIELNQSAIAYAEDRNAALETARADIAAQTERTARAERDAAKERTRRTQERLKHERLIAEHARPECSLPVPVLDSLLDRIRAANAARANPSDAARVPEAVPADARADRPE